MHEASDASGNFKLAAPYRWQVKVGRINEWNVFIE